MLHRSDCCARPTQIRERVGTPRETRIPPMDRERRSRSSPARSRTNTTSLRRRASDSGPAWLTVAQLCRRWQLGRKTIYKFIKADILPAWRVGSHLYRIALADVLRFESRNRLPP